jgi:hypothetical protein
MNVGFIYTICIIMCLYDLSIYMNVQNEDSYIIYLSA